MKKDITEITQNTDGTISFRFTNHLSTGIDNISADNLSANRNTVYNIAGQRVTNANTLSRGLYIINGKKVLR